jgi:hypothetical protein
MSAWPGIFVRWIKFRTSSFELRTSSFGPEGRSSVAKLTRPPRITRIQFLADVAQRQSTAFVKRGLWVQIPPSALVQNLGCCVERRSAATGISTPSGMSSRSLPFNTGWKSNDMVGLLHSERIQTPNFPPAYIAPSVTRRMERTFAVAGSNSTYPNNPVCTALPSGLW